MSRIRGTGNATTEVKLARLLRRHRLTGWRRGARLLGRPDFTWHRQRLVVFVDGCFWHGHGCGRNVAPKTNAELWARKISGNKKRDRRVTRELRRRGWSVLRIWECSLRRNPAGSLARVSRKLAGRAG